MPLWLLTMYMQCLCYSEVVYSTGSVLMHYRVIRRRTQSWSRVHDCLVSFVFLARLRLLTWFSCPKQLVDISSFHSHALLVSSLRCLRVSCSETVTWRQTVCASCKSRFKAAVAASRSKIEVIADSQYAEIARPSVLGHGLRGHG